MPNKSRADRTKEAMTLLIDSTNSMTGEEEMVEGMLKALSSSHRTLQQSFFRVFTKTMNKYSESNCDLRNEASIEFAKKVKELDHHFPFV